MGRRGESMVGLRRGVRLLEALARRPQGLPFGELQALFDEMVPSTLSRLLKTMQEEGLVAQSEAGRRYALGERALALGTLLAGAVPPAERLAPVIESLARTSGRSAAFCEMRGAAVVLAAKFDMPEAFHYGTVGNRLRTVGQHAFALVCLAHADDQTLQAVRAQAEQAEAAPAEAPVRPLGRPWERFAEELAAIRERGILVRPVDDQPGLKRIAAPVLTGAERSCAGAIGVSFFDPLDEALETQLTGLVKSAAREAARVAETPSA